MAWYSNQLINNIINHVFNAQAKCFLAENGDWS